MNKLSVLLRHLWLDESDTQRAIPADMLKRLADRVAASEQRHSGEIRLCIEAALPASYLWRLDRENTLTVLTRQRAVMLFGKLRVWDTEHNNGLLIYVLLADRAVEIVADRGIHVRVGTEAWREVCHQMEASFGQSHYEAGAINGVQAVTQHLVQHFPADSQGNELPDKPVLL